MSNDLKIEVGRKYELVNGLIVTIVAARPTGLGYEGQLRGNKLLTGPTPLLWSERGRALPPLDKSYDIVRAYDAEPADPAIELPASTKPRPWAREIKAWAEGAEIEQRRTPRSDWIPAGNPDWSPSVEYRIKPQPITRWIPLLRMPAGAIVACEGKVDRESALKHKKSYGDTLHKILVVRLTPDGRELIDAKLESP